MQTKQITAAYDLFVEIHVDYVGKSVGEIQAEISPEQFEERIYALFSQYSAGEFQSDVSLN
jgi:hypothetical protein